MNFILMILIGSTLHQGMTWEERDIAWNLALHKNLEEVHSDPITIAFLYQQMHEYPLAILYLERAKVNSTFQGDINQKLEEIRKIGGIPPPKTDPFLMRLVNILSIKTWNVLGVLLTFTLVAILLYRIFTGRFLRLAQQKTTATLGVIILGLFVALQIKTVFAPIKAVVLEPSYLYTEAKETSTPLNTPLVGGEIVKVIKAVPEQMWFEVMTDDHRLGYISSEKIRGIDI